MIFDGQSETSDFVNKKIQIGREAENHILP